MLVAGDLDYVLRIRVRDVDALKKFLLEKVQQIESVSHTSTMLVLEVSKSIDDFQTLEN